MVLACCGLTRQLALPYFMLHQDYECLCQEEARNEKSRLTACGPFEYPPFIVIAIEAQ
jgi:hypothetical protein